MVGKVALSHGEKCECVLILKYLCLKLPALVARGIHDML